MIYLSFQVIQANHPFQKVQQILLVLINPFGQANLSFLVWCFQGNQEVQVIPDLLCLHGDHLLLHNLVVLLVRGVKFQVLLSVLVLPFLLVILPFPGYPQYH